MNTAHRDAVMYFICPGYLSSVTSRRPQVAIDMNFKGSGSAGPESYTARNHVVERYSTF